MKYPPRAYQSLAVDRLRENFRAGIRKQILVMPTGAGKTATAAIIIESALRKGKRILFLAHRKELIDQCSKTLDEFGVDHGIIKGKHWRTRPELPVQVASVQTLLRRERPVAEVVVLDEAHRSLNDSNQTILGWYPDALSLGLTATPWRLDGRGLGAMYETIVAPITVRECIEQNYLLPFRIYEPERPDLKNLPRTGGDFNQKALAQRIGQNPKRVGNIVENWLELGEQQRTLVFATSCEDSRDIVRRFTEAGVHAEHLDGDTNETLRDQTLTRLASGETQVVSNVDVLCLDAETEILTSQGFVGIDEMTPEHAVANWHEDNTITFERPTAIVKRDRKVDERMVTISGREVDARLTEDHRVLHRPFPRCKLRVRSAAELVGKSFVIPVSGVARPFPISVEEPRRHKIARSRRLISITYYLTQHGMSRDAARAEARRRVAHDEELRYSAPENVTLDECRLIGFWIGDGCRITLQSGGVEYRLSQSMAYPVIVAWVDDLLATIGLSVRRHVHAPRAAPKSSVAVQTNDQVVWSLSRGTGFGPQSRSGVYRIESYLCKDGSALWWGFDEPQFDALLEGFWLADGLHGAGVSRPKSMRLYNTNQSLMELLQAIATCRGYRTSLILQKHENPRFKPMYHLRCAKKREHQAKNDRFAFEPNWKAERVWCVSTASGFIVTRRRGRVIVLGNCEGYDLPSLGCIVLARSTMSLTRYLQQVGRGSRPYESQRYCIVLDHAGCVHRLGMPDRDRNWTLEDRGKPKDPNAEPAEPITCEECMTVRPPNVWRCPKCWGEQQAWFEGLPVEVDGRLVERSANGADNGMRCKTCRSELVDLERFNDLQVRVTCRECNGRSYQPDPVATRQASETRRKAELARLEQVQRDKGFKPTWVAYAYKDLFGTWPPKEWQAKETP